MPLLRLTSLILASLLLAALSALAPGAKKPALSVLNQSPGSLQPMVLAIETRGDPRPADPHATASAQVGLPTGLVRQAGQLIPGAGQ